MRRVLPYLTASILAVALVGCGKAAPTGTLAVDALPPASPVQAASAPSAPAPEPALSAVAAPSLAEASMPVITTGAPPVELDEPPADAPAEAGDDPKSISIAAVDGAPDGSYRIDERTPYGVVVVERSAHTATIAWRTDVATKGIVQYGRTWGFDKNGYTDSFRDDVAKTDHKITITGLRRFTSYTFLVTAVTPLGLQFSDKTPRKFRTKFWAWR